MRRVISPTFPSFSTIVLAILGPSPYTINFRISSFISIRRPTEILVEIVLNLMSVQGDLTFTMLHLNASTFKKINQKKLKNKISIQEFTNKIQRYITNKMMDNINIVIDKTFTEIKTYSQYTKKANKNTKYLNRTIHRRRFKSTTSLIIRQI